MKQETSKVKYKIRHITDYNHLGEAKLDNASHEYVVAVEKQREIADIMKEESDKGWVFLMRKTIGEWGHEVFFEHDTYKKRKKAQPLVKPIVVKTK